MRTVRTSDDLTIVDGSIRTLEWFWAADGVMPGLDAFERLDTSSQAAMVATFIHWANLPHGKRVSESRLNEEHDDPKILAAKSGKHRFTVFHAAGDVWVVHRYYEKRKAKLDNIGKAAVKTTIAAIWDYRRRVEDNSYYERD